MLPPEWYEATFNNVLYNISGPMKNHPNVTEIEEGINKLIADKDFITLAYICCCDARAFDDIATIDELRNKARQEITAAVPDMWQWVRTEFEKQFGVGPEASQYVDLEQYGEEHLSNIYTVAEMCGNHYVFQVRD